MSKNSSNYGVRRHLNFFRIHLLAFTFIPLIFSAIFYGANGKYKIPYIDSLFICFSAGTVTGLTTANLSTLTGFQQAILFVLMALGDQTVVSLIVVLVRKRWFQQRLDRMLKNDKLRRSETMASRAAQQSSRPGNKRGRTSTVDAEGGGLRRRTLSARMHISGPSHGRHFAIYAADREPSDDVKDPSSALALEHIDPHPLQSTVDRSVDTSPFSEKTQTLHDSPTSIAAPEQGLPPCPSPKPTSANHQPHPSLSFDLPPKPILNIDPMTASPVSLHSPGLQKSGHAFQPHQRQQSADPYPFSDEHPQAFPGGSSIDHGMGGFSLSDLVPRQVKRRLTKNLTNDLRRTTTLVSKHDRGGGQGKKGNGDGIGVVAVKWLTFDGLLVGRNSLFKLHNLSHEQLEGLGGVEYRALRILGYLVGAYFVLTQLVSFLLIYPQLVVNSSWNDAFTNQAQSVGKAWFSVFQVLSAYSGTGMSLVDPGMVPFSTNYLMIISLIFVILCGNQALPLFLRLLVWICSKLVSVNSETEEALQFLLAHPRRCFLYLFPARETWMLAIVLALFTVIEIVGFGVLNIGLPVIEAIPVGQRIADSFFQSLCIRATGFQIVSIAAVAPALQFLYVLLMYIAVYPVALSVRSSNVYEEVALGVNEVGHRPVEEKKADPIDEGHPAETELFSKYLASHARRQLAFDLWPLSAAILLICVIERRMIMDDDKAPWFNIFRIVFELVSAYGTIGLSLGIPTENYSFSGSFRPLSKLVVIAIMLRGRHRGLPQAIDRAILLPREFKKAQERPTQPEPTDEFP